MSFAWKSACVMLGIFSTTEGCMGNTLDKNALVYIKQVQEDKERAKLRARTQKRREYMERESARNDGPFFALLLSFFVLPAAVILAIAFSSGYLDTIAESYRR
jgi:hypothetical protein